MRKNIKQIELITDQLETTGTGYDLLRYVALPDLLGKDAPKILYVMGKNLARELSFESIEDIASFFYKTGWGTLELIKENRSEHVFKLQARSISERHRLGIETDYRLESGFLAAAIEQLNTYRCECIEKEKPKKNYVELCVQHYH
ncbi:YslB family protein [Amphibacillus sp. MSJ-3]|uniref:YslB family protein n=1 Tax=Amphibacillus sp. MSJ-3 TaxID=2841505 RepID=UPI001C0ECE36|nr:YslB family protein [Amphibacillus sp. MSJ-3]MBU5593622.1 YslB family protein [Amphibacillus sp. MSJ-3]